MNTTPTVVDAELRGPLTDAERAKHLSAQRGFAIPEIERFLVDGVIPDPSSASQYVDEKVSLIFLDRAETLGKKGLVERVVDGAGPYSIGSTTWPGVSKVVESA